MKFSTGEILSAATGRLMCDKMSGVYQILSFFTGTDVYTHQLPMVLRQVRPIILAQCPWIDEDDIRSITKDNWKEKLQEYVEQFGNSHELIANPELIEKVDPIDETNNIFGKGNVSIIVGPLPSLKEKP